MVAKAFNVIKFNARGFNFLNGELKVEASFKIASEMIKSSTIFCFYFQNYELPFLN